MATCEPIVVAYFEHPPASLIHPLHVYFRLHAHVRQRMSEISDIAGLSMEPWLFSCYAETFTLGYWE